MLIETRETRTETTRERPGRPESWSGPLPVLVWSLSLVLSLEILSLVPGPAVSLRPGPVPGVPGLEIRPQPGRRPESWCPLPRSGRTRTGTRVISMGINGLRGDVLESMVCAVPVGNPQGNPSPTGSRGISTFLGARSTDCGFSGKRGFGKGDSLRLVGGLESSQRFLKNAIDN